jgi:hypothetical protein
LIEERELPRFHVFDSGLNKSAGGKSRFADALRIFRTVRPKTFASLKDIIIVADNDKTPGANFDDVCSQIETIFGPGTRPTALRQRTTKIKPAVSVLMMPWDNINGHLEALCVDSARDAAKGVGTNVDSFLALVGADDWKDAARYSKAWLRSNLAVRCSADPFVALGHVFEHAKNHHLIPVNHKSLDQIAKFLASYG